MKAPKKLKPLKFTLVGLSLFSMAYSSGASAQKMSPTRNFRPAVARPFTSMQVRPVNLNYSYNYGTGQNYVMMPYRTNFANRINQANLGRSVLNRGVITSNSGMNVRATPNGRILGALPSGSPVDILQNFGDWQQILFNGQTAMVHSSGLGQLTDFQTEAGFCPNCIGQNRYGGIRNDPNAYQIASNPLRRGMFVQGANQMISQSNMVQGRYAPIMDPFRRAFQECAGGCTYSDVGVWGDARHQARRSCHNSGSAIDVNGLRCGGASYGPRSPQFRRFTQCMHGRQGLYVIFGSGQHTNHADIAIAACQMGGEGKLTGAQYRAQARRR